MRSFIRPALRPAVRQGELDASSRLTALLSALILLGAAPVMAGAAPARHAPAPDTTAKPTAPIAIDYELASEPAVGQPLDLVVSVSVGRDMTAGSLTLKADDPLAVIDPVAAVALGDIAVGDVVDVRVTVLPLVVQTHHLDVTVAGTIDGLVQTRSISIPIRVPGAGLRKAENEVTGKTTETVRSFGAVENVR